MLLTIALVFFLGVILYTAVVIKEERDAYREHSLMYSLQDFTFFFPSWWKEVSRTQESIRFERRDWFVQLTVVPYSSLSVLESMKNFIKERKLVFDKNNSNIFRPYSLRTRPEIEDGLLEVVRVEGTATQQGETRVYYDIFLFKDHRNNQCLLCESQSSVLSGMVEGPYFEEAMENYQFSRGRLPFVSLYAQCRKLGN